MTSKEPEIYERARRAAEAYSEGASFQLDAALDVSAAAWAGQLLALVREAWGDSWDNISWNAGGAAVTVRAPGLGNAHGAAAKLLRMMGASSFHSTTLAEALVAALEAAP